MVEVDPDWTAAERRAPKATEELIYGGLRTSEGIDVSSKRRHREYCRANNLGLADDYRQTWSKAAEERAKAFTPGAGYDRAARREAIGRTIYELEKRGRK
jgi:hypothetical protein